MGYCTQKPECNVCLLGFETAEEFYASKHWCEVTEKVLERDEHKCELCSGTATVVRTTQWQASLLLGYNSHWFVSLCQSCDTCDGTELRQKVYGELKKRGWKNNKYGQAIGRRARASRKVSEFFRNKHGDLMKRLYDYSLAQRG